MGYFFLLPIWGTTALSLSRFYPLLAASLSFFTTILYLGQFSVVKMLNGILDDTVEIIN